MNSDKTKFNYQEVELPEGILGKILKRIDKEKRLNLRRRLIIFSVGFVLSLIALIPVSKIVYSSFYESGFFQFFSLIFSDFQIVITYWQSFVIALLESIPATAVIVFLATFLIFFEFLNFLWRDLKIVLRNHIIN